MHLSQELGTTIATVLGLATGWVSRNLLHKSPAPAVPDKDPAPTPDGNQPEPVVIPSNLSNPILSLLWLVLISWFSRSKSVQTESDPYTETAAMSALATAIKSDPDRLAKMKSLLN